MKKSAWMIILFPVMLNGQVSDNFSDGDFTQNPSWIGDADHFKVSSSTAVPESQRPALQLNAPEAGQSHLTVSAGLSGNLEWRFWIKLSLNTSSGNYSRIYLLSEKDSLKVPLKGYFLQFGGAVDSVDFFRADGQTTSHLLRLKTLFTGNSTNALRLRITRSDDGLWEFFGDPGGTNFLDSLGEIADMNYPAGQYFGILFQYTGSNTSRFYFDDFYAGPLTIDTIPPSLLRISAVNPNQVAVTFNEPVNQESAENELNYEVTPDIGNPYSAIRLLEPSEVRLFFDRELLSGRTYLARISNIRDMKGNISEVFSSDITYYRPSPFDIIFTEIMADPSPPQGLPGFEYLEILNRSTIGINLDGWRIAISSAEHELPQVVIEPGEYFILCGQDAAGTLQSYGRAIGIDSFVLSNNGTSLHLTGPEGKSICHLEYDPSWYRDELKSEGGYSLEIADIQNPCLQSENWRASGHPDGGTPGSVNYNTDISEKAIRLDGVCCVSEHILEVAFSQSIDSSSAVDITKYAIEPEEFEILEAEPLPPEFDHVRLTLDIPGRPGSIYDLTVAAGLRNCIGELIEEDVSRPFGWTEACDPFDVVINEILFNPLGDGVDFVEIYNRSRKAILLSGFKLGSIRETPPNPADTTFVSLTSECRSILPGDYLVLTKNPEIIRSQYMLQNPDVFLEMSSFPYFSNDMGCVLLYYEGKVIDGIHYRDDMHFLMLNSTEGVSLERICPDRLGDDPGNWHSASETSGFATPGYQNSQYLEKWTDEASLSVHPETFTPDGDGVDDHLGVSYRFGEPGKLITILVFSSEGLFTRTLVNNEMPGTSGICSWDGTLDDRTPARQGVYVIYMEALDMEGRTSRFRKACVLARRR